MVCVLCSGACEALEENDGPLYASCKTARDCVSALCLDAPGGAYCAAACTDSSCVNGDCIQGACFPRCELGTCPVPLECRALGARSVCTRPEATVSCDPAFESCDGTCVNLQTSATHCGSCGQECGNGMCMSGECVCPTDAPQRCGDTCVSLQTSPQHCGECDTACSGSHTDWRCHEANCVVASCEAGWSDCNGLANDGCERDASGMPTAKIAVMEELLGHAITGFRPETTVLLDGTQSLPGPGATILKWDWQCTNPYGQTVTPVGNATASIELLGAGSWRCQLDVEDSAGGRSCPPAESIINSQPLPVHYYELTWPGNAELDLHLRRLAPETDWFSTLDCWEGNPDADWGTSNLGTNPDCRFYDNFEVAEGGGGHNFLVEAAVHRRSDGLGATVPATLRFFLQGRISYERTVELRERDLWKVAEVDLFGTGWVPEASYLDYGAPLVVEGVTIPAGVFP
jgi:hypothetical protein